MMPLENISPQYIDNDSFNAPESVHPFVCTALQDASAQTFEFHTAFQKVERNFEMLANEIVSLRNDMYEQQQMFERFVSNHFTPRTIASRVTDMMGGNESNESSDALRMAVRSLLHEIDSYCNEYGATNYVNVDAGEVIDLWYKDHGSALDTVEKKIDFLTDIIMPMRTNRVLDFMDGTLLSDDSSCVFKRNVHDHLHEDTERAVIHILNHESANTACEVIFDGIHDIDLKCKFIDAVMDADVSEGRTKILPHVLRWVERRIDHPSGNDTDSKVYAYADRLFRRPDAFDFFMGLHITSRERIRNKCLKLDNYLKVKFPYGE